MIVIVYKRLKITTILKNITFSTVRSSSVVHDGNLHTTWFCLVKSFPRGTVSRWKNVLVCLELVSCKQFAGFPLLSSEKQFSRCMQCICAGWVFCEVTGQFGVVRLVLVFYLSYCEVSFCFPNVGFATWRLGTIDDIWFVPVFIFVYLWDWISFWFSLFATRW